MRSSDGTSGHGRPDIEVDLAGLARLASTLRSLAGEMATRNGSLQGLLDDPDLGDSLRHADRDWWDQRRRLHRFLTQAAEGVSSSAQSYQDVEHALVRALDGGRQGR